MIKARKLLVEDFQAAALARAIQDYFPNISVFVARGDVSFIKILHFDASDDVYRNINMFRNGFVAAISKITYGR